MKLYNLEISIVDEKTGDIVMTQENGFEEDDRIVLSKEQAKIVGAELIKLADSQ